MSPAPVGLLGEVREAGHPLLAGMRNGAWLHEQEFPPLEWVAPGVIPQGSTLLVGAPKVGKSWLTLDLALGLACGGVAFGRVPTGLPRPVLLLALEDGERRLQDRCRKLLPTAPIPALLDFITRIEPGAVFDTIEAWFSFHEGASPVVILDTLGRVMPVAMPGESAYARDYRVGAQLKRIVDDQTGASLVVNHHDRKASSDDFVDAVSGTHGLAGAADTTVVIARKRHETVGLVKVTGRDVPENEYAMRVVDGISWQLDGADLAAAARRAEAVRETGNLGDRSIDVFTFVTEHPEGVSPAQVDDALGLTDSRTYLGRLVDSGRIARPSRGKYAPLPVGVLQVSQVLQVCGESDTRNGCNTATGDDDFPYLRTDS